MASYFTRDRSPFFQLRVQRADGTWTSRSSGVRIDAPGGVRLIHQMVAKETQKESCDAGDGVSAMFNRWVPKWIEYAYTNEGTRSGHQRAWASLSSYFGIRRVLHPGEVSYGLCHDYMAWRTTGGKDRKAVKWNSVTTELRLLAVVMQEALRRGFVIANPCARLGMARRDTKQKRAITRDEEALIFSKLKEPWMIESFLVAMKQGCRLREVQVPLQRINTEADPNTITFKVKGGRMHPAPLHKDLLPLVERARAEKRKVLVPQPPASAAAAWHVFFRQIGLDDLCFHCTRVTVVTRLCEAGYSESQTMAYVGHSSSLVHDLYRKMRPVAVAALGDAL